MSTTQFDLFHSLRGKRFHRTRRAHGEPWVESSFIVADANGEHAPLPETREHTSSSLTERALIGAVVLFLLVAIGAITRVGYLQIAYGSDFRAQAVGNSQRLLPIPAERGLIFDRNGVQLIKNVPKFSLALIPQDLPRDEDEREAVITRLAWLTDQEPDVLRETLEQYGSYSYESVTIIDDMDYEHALSVQIAAADLPGLRIQRGSKRLYLHTGAGVQDGEEEIGDGLSHVLGYIGKLSPDELAERYDAGYLPTDDIGKTGVERSYETFLRGTYGQQRIEVDAAGREQAVLAEQPPTHGHHLTLTIDSKIQQILQDVLEDGMEDLDTRRASAIAMDPRNGEILAMVSLPAFDNNLFSGGIDRDQYASYIQDPDRPLFNRTIAGTYPSGSTIKIAIAAIALDQGVVTPQTIIPSSGGVRVGQWFFPDWQAGGHGATNVTRAIAWSVNTFFYYVGGGYDAFDGLGVERLRSGLVEFGLSTVLGIDLPGERSGFLPSREWKEETKGEQWYIGDTYNFSIGQGDVLVTPLQVADMTSMVANGGTLYRPHVVRAVTDPQTGEERQIQQGILERGHFRTEDLATVRLGMRECVTYGSCRRLSLLPFETAGKSGTAQWSSTGETHAWFTAFAPYQDPEVVVTVLVEEGGGGSAVAAPIAHQFLQRWWSYTRGVAVSAAAPPPVTFTSTTAVTP